MADFKIGDRVRALVDCNNDLCDDGLGIEHCASRGDELIVRRESTIPGRLCVSHEHITDRSFLVDPHEIELVAPAPQDKDAATSASKDQT
jgi:hypothetical protein